MATRDQLKKEFKDGECPSQEDYFAIFDSTINFNEDGVDRPTGNNPLKIKATTSPTSLAIEGNLQIDKGKVGIGISSPTASLHIVNSGNNLVNFFTVEDKTNGAIPFIINSHGRVGIGRSPIATLHIFNNSSDPDISIPSFLIERKEINKPFIVDEYGRVGVGTNKPLNLLTLRDINPVLEFYGGRLPIPIDQDGNIIGQIRWYGTTTTNKRELMAEINVIHEDMNSASMQIQIRNANNMKEVFKIGKNSAIGGGMNTKPLTRQLVYSRVLLGLAGDDYRTKENTVEKIQIIALLSPLLCIPATEDGATRKYRIHGIYNDNITTTDYHVIIFEYINTEESAWTKFILPKVGGSNVWGVKGIEGYSDWVSTEIRSTDIRVWAGISEKNTKASSQYFYLELEAWDFFEEE